MRSSGAADDRAECEVMALLMMIGRSVADQHTGHGGVEVLIGRSVRSYAADDLTELAQTFMLKNASTNASYCAKKQGHTQV